MLRFGWHGPVNRFDLIFELLIALLPRSLLPAKIINEKDESQNSQWKAKIVHRKNDALEIQIYLIRIENARIVGFTFTLKTSQSHSCAVYFLSLFYALYLPVCIFSSEQNFGGGFHLKHSYIHYTYIEPRSSIEQKSYN